MITHVLVLLLFQFSLLSFAQQIYNVIDFGADNGGNVDSTNAFGEAWHSTCSSNTPSILLVPNGEFLLRPYIFSGPCQSEKVEVRIEGTIVAPINDNEIENSEYWIKFDQIDGLEIYGGTIDARADYVWKCKRSGGNCPHGSRFLDISGENIKIVGLTSVNSNQQHIMIHKCEGVEVSGVHILAPESSPNTDGIHVMKSSNVRIIETSIKTGDDCISIGHGTKGLHIQNIECGPGHGISIGSLGYYEWRQEEVQDITVDGAVIKGAQNGLRIKTVAKDNHGFVEGIFYNNITMVDVFNPIIIDQNYCPHNSCYSYEVLDTINLARYILIHFTTILSYFFVREYRGCRLG
ncbi:Polygalacturonase, family GH28 [Zostera marina]|uniref:Polygalacturonase, family GH28 n=1 Tax=Zostera marina TaxID=29655 RepID=A0A0K9PZH2_ZOSMR|nr:Polygalacturonase, family GH28 [Zostera marina]